MPTQTVEKLGTDQDTVSTTPMKETVPGPEHNQQDTTFEEDGASVAADVKTDSRTVEEAPTAGEHRNGVYVSKRTLIVGSIATAVAITAAIFVPRVVASDAPDETRQEPGISAAPFPSTVETPPPTASQAPETSAPVEALTPLPPEMQKYLDPTVPYTEQVPGSETNLDAILAGLLKQRETAINTDRLDILRSLYFSGSDFNPLRELDEDIMKLTKKNKYLFDGDWKRAAAVKATVPHPSDPTVGSMEVWKVTVQGTDMHRARQLGESYPMPREYDMTFYLLKDTAHDADGDPAGQVWTIAGNYSGADFAGIQEAYAGEIR